MVNWCSTESLGPIAAIVWAPPVCALAMVLIIANMIVIVKILIDAFIFLFVVRLLFLCFYTVLAKNVF